MQLRLIFVGIAGLLMALAGEVVAYAADVTIENDRGRKIKVCSYSSDDKRVLRPRKCWFLEKDQKILWKRNAGDGAFDLRVFGPGVFELPICVERRIGLVFHVTVSPAKAATCVTTRYRSQVAGREWKIGDRVLVNRDGDNFWYPAKILAKKNDAYRLQLSNYRTAMETADYIMADDMRVGSRVESNWKRQGRWYPGTLLSRKGETVKIQYDAGWTEAGTIGNLRVTPEMVGKLPQPQIDTP